MILSKKINVLSVKSEKRMHIEKIANSFQHSNVSYYFLDGFNLWFWFLLWPKSCFWENFSYPACLLLCCFGLKGLYFYMLSISTCIIVRKWSLYFFLFKCIEASLAGNYMDNFCRYLWVLSIVSFLRHGIQSIPINTTLPII